MGPPVSFFNSDLLHPLPVANPECVKQLRNHRPSSLTLTYCCKFIEPRMVVMAIITLSVPDLLDSLVR